MILQALSTLTLPFYVASMYSGIDGGLAEAFVLFALAECVLGFLLSLSLSSCCVIALGSLKL